MLHFSAKGPLLHSNCTPFTLQLYSICTVNVVLLKLKRTTNEKQDAIRRKRIRDASIYTSKKYRSSFYS